MYTPCILTAVLLGVSSQYLRLAIKHDANTTGRDTLLLSAGIGGGLGFTENGYNVTELMPCVYSVAQPGKLLCFKKPASIRGYRNCASKKETLRYI